MKPFVKWAGGKKRLLKEIEQRLPAHFSEWDEVTYIEPFVGGGAVLFHMLEHHNNIARVIINDINRTLIDTYKLIQHNPAPLIECLRVYAVDYLALSESAQKDLYYRLRREYNSTREGTLNRIVLFLFLNQTCFNGLYRENIKGEFNVPHGRYKAPRIIDEDNIWAVHTALAGVQIQSGDFSQVGLDIEAEHVFYYFDPPYRPIKEKGNMFTMYDRTGFNDSHQQLLKQMCDAISEKGCHFMLSNSDSKNAEGESYFDYLYHGYNVGRVQVTRNINTYNCEDKRPTEVLITNY